MKRTTITNTVLLVALFVFCMGLGSYGLAGSQASAEPRYEGDQGIEMVYCFHCPSCAVTSVGSMHCRGGRCWGGTCFTNPFE